MRSLRELARAEMLNDPPISIRSLVQRYGVNTVRGLIAGHDIEKTYRQTLMERFGPMGEPTGEISPQPDGAFSRDYQLGFIVKPLGEDCKAFTRYTVDVQLACIRCFATDDPGGTDEPYVIATLVNLNPMKGEDQHIVTKMFGPFSVRGGQTFCKALTIGEGVIPAGTGLRVHIALFDEEGGNHEEVREDVEEYIKEAVKTGAVAVAAAVGVGDVNTASTVAGDALNSNIGRAITGGLSHLVADIWSDDFLGEKTYIINASDIKKVSTQEGLNASLVRGDAELDPDVVYNFPTDPRNPAWMFDQPGQYRVYLLIKAAYEEKGCI